MQIITLNVNGLRSSIKKSLFTWLAQKKPHIICLQETRVQDAPEHFPLPNYYAYFFHAQKRGYGGVALYTRHQPDRISEGLGWPLADQEGRYIQADFGQLSVSSLYIPSGTSGEARQTYKLDFLERYYLILETQAKQSRHYILCGDWNIAHKSIDLKNWRQNQKHSGFLPEERAWLDKVLGNLPYVDAFRIVNDKPEQYTWWSNRGQAWAKNIGWRIDYQIISSSLKDTVQTANIYKAQRFSDHAPLIIDYDLSCLE